MIKLTAREIIHASLAHSYGAGSKRLHDIAVSALSRSGLRPGEDPRLLAIGLGYRIRAMTRVDFMARLEGSCIEFLWEPEPRETGLNMWVGNALAISRDEGLGASRTDIFKLAGFLALPERSISSDGAARLQPFAPLWFLEARRQSGSGTYLAIGS